MGNNHTIQGQSLYTGKELNKFYPIVYGENIAASDAEEESARNCESGSLNATLAKGKAIMCFQSRSQKSATAAQLKLWGGVESWLLFEIVKCNQMKFGIVELNQMKAPILTTEAEGVTPSRAQVYIDTQTRKDGSIVTEKAASIIDELKKHMEEETSSGNAQTTQECSNWKNDIFSKVKVPEKRGRCVRCVGKVCGSSKSIGDGRVKKLENLVGDLVAILQVRFAEDPQVYGLDCNN